MSCHPRVSAWTTRIQTHVPHLTKPHAPVLALGTLGRVLARSWALTAVRVVLATWRSRQEPTVRQHLRACCDAAPATRGMARCALAVTPGLVPVLAWVLTLGQGTPWALALEATT